MTIAVAIKTGSAVVFAADSKLSTAGVVGLKRDGTPQLEDQTYDNATKVVHDEAQVLMAMVAGHANIGRMAATDFISRVNFPLYSDAAAQDGAISELVSRMAEERRAYWSTTKLAEGKWPGPTLLLAAPSPDGGSPHVWRVVLGEGAASVDEVLKYPGVRLEGAYDETFGLLYGVEPSVLNGIMRQLRVRKNRVEKIRNDPKFLRPVDKINFWAMPDQDAIEMAFFLATVQVQMDRFLPGTPACGGPIDVMVMKSLTGSRIQTYLGKKLHHPLSSPLG